MEIILIILFSITVNVSLTFFKYLSFVNKISNLKDIIYEKEYEIKHFQDLVSSYKNALSMELYNRSINDKNINNKLDKNTINKLIRLCHPDKHNNSQVSNEITAKLIKMRDE